MGARAQVKIIDTGVYLYTHWGAKRLLDNVRRALAKRQRWGDEGYLTRIIFECMVPASEHGEETGFAIGTEQYGDIELLVELDCKRQLITWYDPHEQESRSFKSWILFDAFIEGQSI